jgi:hypothetical protein
MNVEFTNHHKEFTPPPRLDFELLLNRDNHRASRGTTMRAFSREARYVLHVADVAACGYYLQRAADENCFESGWAV